jgi:hypothetical protein
MRDQLPHSHKTTRTIIVFFLLVFWFLNRKWEEKILLLSENGQPYELPTAQPIHQIEIEPNVFDNIESVE